MSEDYERAIEGLISSLNNNTSILMVGAGSSVSVGYPSWTKLIELLRDEFYSSLTLEGDLDILADNIKSNAINDEREGEYHKFLERTFQAKQGNTHTSFHTDLVKLGFRGIITTNYDPVLEFAIGAAFSQDEYYHRCSELDLCSKDYAYRIIDYLRSFHLKKVPVEVLHIHGYYQKPENIILTRKDYEDKYGKKIAKIVSERGEEERNKAITLDTLHTKVIWSLLTYYTFVFVGFSLNDPFFVKILDVIKYDFHLDSEVMHFAIMPYSKEEDKEDITKYLKHKGIKAIFYHVPENDPQDHSYLNVLISEISKKLNEGDIITEEEPEEREEDIETEEEPEEREEDIETEEEPGERDINILSRELMGDSNAD